MKRLRRARSRSGGARDAIRFPACRARATCPAAPRLRRETSGIEVGERCGTSTSASTARNAFRRPGFWNFDFGVQKNLPLAEHVSLQLRAELYNALNHANLYVADFETDIATLAYVPAFYQGRRQVQLAAKLAF